MASFLENIEPQSHDWLNRSESLADISWLIIDKNSGMDFFRDFNIEFIDTDYIIPISDLNLRPTNQTSIFVYRWTPLLIIIIFYFLNVTFFHAELGSSVRLRVEDQTSGDTL